MKQRIYFNYEAVNGFTVELNLYFYRIFKSINNFRLLAPSRSATSDPLTSRRANPNNRPEKLALYSVLIDLEKKIINSKHIKLQYVYLD